VQSGIRQLKKFSQNFLKNQLVARTIIDSLNIKRGDIILEIGPGEGILTELLINSFADKIIGVEIDFRFARWLRHRFIDEKRLFLIDEDILKVDINSLAIGENKIRIVGNLPYAITSPILFYLLNNRMRIQDITVMIQKEVGERISSKPGSKVYGIPSVLFQIYSSIEMLFSISRNEFYPVPEVDSCVIKMTFFDEPCFNIIDNVFFNSLVRSVFGMRRKMLRNSLKSIYNEEINQNKISIDLSRRPEQLSIEEFVRLSNELIQQNNR
jgi:16S rRNA (adenine1518-N6/adenine1519-N6)-dimethyltransferase